MALSMRLTKALADADHRDLAKLCGYYLIVLVFVMLAYGVGFAVYLSGNFGDKFVWLKWFRMTYTIFAFTGYLVLSLIAIWWNHFRET